MEVYRIRKEGLTVASDNSIKPRILAVDDSRVMRRAMTKVLGKEYDVVEAEHGEDAWTYLTNDQTIQIVFTDLSMPYLDGFGLLERMRSSDEPHLQEMPVIIITGKDDDDDTKQQALDKGASDFITKPFDSVQLQARAKAHIKFEQTTRKLSETSNKLERQATIDEVTGLGGQRYFCKAAEESLAYIKRHGGLFTLLRMDIDDFNTIFINNGKVFADAILTKIGEALKKLVRQEDMLARIGLAKFAMLLKDTSIEDAMILAERVQKEINALSFKAGEHVLKITVSIGLLEPKIDDDSNIKDLITEAEKYLAKAVAAGGNRVVVKSLRKAAGETHIDINTAIRMLHDGREKQLKPHLAHLVTQLIPLLNYIAEQSGEELITTLNALTEKIES